MKSTFLQKALLASTLASTVIFAASVQAQRGAPVVDLSASQSPKSAVQPSAAAGDSYYQSQMLQDEVRELRGMVEELSYELQRVKQRQMDDYLDIDRRLSALAGGAVPIDNSFGDTGGATSPVDMQANQSVVPSNMPENSAEITASYTQASNLLLKDRDINAAALAFKSHVIDFPDSPYLANVHYWLGEIYLLQGQDEQARQSFALVVEQYPNHAKALDANFKLGKLYNELGDKKRARELLQRAAQGTGATASKAKSYLESNF